MEGKYLTLRLRARMQCRATPIMVYMFCNCIICTFLTRWLGFRRFGPPRHRNRLLTAPTNRLGRRSSVRSPRNHSKHNTRTCFTRQCRHAAAVSPTPAWPAAASARTAAPSVNGCSCQSVSTAPSSPGGLPSDSHATTRSCDGATRNTHGGALAAVVRLASPALTQCRRSGAATRHGAPSSRSRAPCRRPLPTSAAQAPRLPMTLAAPLRPSCCCLVRALQMQQRTPRQQLPPTDNMCQQRDAATAATRPCRSERTSCCICICISC